MEFIPVCEPFLNGNELAYVNDCLISGWISSSGKYVQSFEEQIAKYCDARYAVAVCNGTVALHVALVAAGIKNGDEVIIPDFTMIASAFAVCYTGAMPVFVDAERDTWNIDVSRIENKISSRTKAIMPVSIFGHPCNMDEINSIAKKYNLLVIEDAAESHGAEYKGSRTGNLAHVTAFSFFANKNITTGEGGMIVTNNDDLHRKLRYFKNLCFSLDGPRNYIHDEIGFNYRMTNIQAAIGLAQMEKADEYRNMRIRNAELYRQFLMDTPGITFQNIDPDVLHVHWMNVIVVDPVKYGKTRDQLVTYLATRGIDTRLLFVGMHLQPALKKYGCEINGSFPVSEWLTRNGLYLPSASNLREETIHFICNEITRFRTL